jgi:hypothetical protein
VANLLFFLLYKTNSGDGELCLFFISVLMVSVVFNKEFIKQQKIPIATRLTTTIRITVSMYKNIKITVNNNYMSFFLYGTFFYIASNLYFVIKQKQSLVLYKAPCNSVEISLISLLLRDI